MIKRFGCTTKKKNEKGEKAYRPFNHEWKSTLHKENSLSHNESQAISTTDKLDTPSIKLYLFFVRQGLKYFKPTREGR